MKAQKQIKTKHEEKVGQKARKPYAAPKLNALGKIERITAGSGGSTCYFSW